MSKVTRISNVIVVGFIAIVLAFMAISVNCDDDALFMKPDRIILNAVGSYDSIMANFPGQVGIYTIPGGGRFESILTFLDADGAPLCDANGDPLEPIYAYSFYYCAIDDVLHVYFDRQKFQEIAEEAELQGSVLVRVTFDIYDVNNVAIKSHIGEDEVEILSPGKSEKGGI